MSGILNLVSSVHRHFGQKTAYAPMHLELKGSIVFILIDGLGYNYLQRHGSFMKRHCHARLKTVFPPTTAAAITSIATGRAPSEHGVVGWFTYMKELGCVTTPLRFAPRCGGQLEMKPQLIYTQKPLMKSINSYAVHPRFIIGSEFNRAYYSKNLGFTTLKGMLRQIKIALKKPGRKLVYAYWPLLDTLGHEFGIDSLEAKEHFREIEGEFERFCRSCSATVVLTGDHGHMTTTEQHTIWLNDHPRLQECLALPLSGEPRAAICYLRLGKEKQFLTYVKKHFRGKLKPVKSTEMARLYGPRPTKKFMERIGDYILVAEKDYIVKDWLLSEEKGFKPGHHGGMSDDEMYVPLVKI